MMEIAESPNPVDEPNLIYKLQTKRRIFEEGNFPNRGYNLVTTSSKYALVFIGLPSPAFSVYCLSDLIDPGCEEAPRLVLPLPQPPTHLAVSSDRETLAVCTQSNLHLYSIKSLQNENVNPLTVAINNNAGAHAVAVQWNPCVVEMIAVAFSDGSLLVGQAKGGEVPFNKIPAKARCLCWSPKGKQLVTGNSDGTLTQYKPELAPVKSVPAPNICSGAPVEVLAVHWLSNFQFAAVYRNAADDSRPYVTIVNTPKGGAPVCINYEDVCYSMMADRPWYYYLQSVAQWGIIISASSNSLEVATLGTSDGNNWVQWCQSEEAKPELPLTDKKRDSYPIGIAFDTSALHQLPWGESDTLPHMPLLLILAHTGYLVAFNAINLRAGVQQLCSPPESIALPRHRMIVSQTPAPQPPPPAAAPSTMAPPPAMAPPPTAAPPMVAPPPTLAQPISAAPQNLTQPMSAAAPPTSAKPTPAPAQSVFKQQPPSYGNTMGASFGGNGQQKTATEPPPAQTTKPIPTQQQEREASEGRAEEVRAAAARAGEEMRTVLVKEANAFQAELGAFLNRMRKLDVKLDMNQAVDIGVKLQELKETWVDKRCSLESVNNAIVDLKLGIVKTFALLAEARGQPRDNSSGRIDPTAARMAEAVKRRLGRLQEQMRAAQDELCARTGADRNIRDRMTIPTLEAVYQPLVKQQEILNRQTALIKSLSKSLQEIMGPPNNTPLIKGFSKDPLSKLSQNVLNMSIGEERQTAAPQGLSPQKLEALRDLLSNHKIVRIKPVNMEVRRHVANMQETHDRLLKEMKQLKLQQKAQQINITQKSKQPEPITIKSEPQIAKPPEIEHPKPAPISQSTPISKPSTKEPIKLSAPQAVIVDGSTLTWPKSAEGQPVAWWGQANLAPHQGNQGSVLNWAQPKQEGSGKSVTITPANIASVSRNLFAEQAKQETPQPTKGPADTAPKPAAKPAQTEQTKPAKSEDNTFFGQKICSPASPASKPFGESVFSTPTTKSIFSGPSTTSIFGGDSKPLSFESKPAQKPKEITKPPASSPETGESDDKITKEEPKKPPAQSIFGAPTADKNNDVESEISSIFASKISSRPAETKEKSAVSSTQHDQLKTDDKAKVFGEAKSTASSIFGTSTASTVAGSIFGAATKPKATPTTVSSPPTPAAGADLTAASAAAAAALAAANAAAGADTGAPKSPPASVAASSANSALVAALTSTGGIFSSAQAQSPTSEAPSIFGTAPTSTPASVFGSSPASPASPSSPEPTPAAPATPASAFGSPAVTQSSIFGSPSATSVFGSPTAQSARSVFGAVSTETSFGTPASTSVFGSPVTTTAAFGTTTPTSGSIFGTPSTAAPTSVFGSPANTTPVFGTSAASPSVFGSPATTASVFGTPTATTASIFGTAATTTPSIFGTSGATVFGTPTTTASVFGTSATTPPVFGASTTASVFGSPASGGSIFGSPATTSVSIFGSTATTNAFGATATSASSSVFETANMFGATSLGTSSQPSANVFGSSNTGSVFGANNTNVFGAKTTFGQTNQSSIFGGSPTTFGQQKPATNVFGSSSGFGSSFAPQATQASSIFGGGSFSTPSTTPFGSPAPPQPMFGTPPADGASVFGSPQQTGSTFGGGAVFGAKPMFGQTAAFGSSGGQAGFGAPAAFNKGPGFGGGSVFGGSPTFGGTGFGGSSPGKVFGGSPGGFGGSMQQSSTFENLAGQNTLSFGNLAQQSQQQQPTAFNKSPSFSGWRG